MANIIFVDNGDRAVGEIHFPYHAQIIRTVIFYGETTAQERLEVFKAVVSRIAESRLVYARWERDISGILDVKNKLDEIPYNEIVAALKRAKIDTVVAVHKTVEDALQTFMSEVGLDGLRYTQSPGRMGDDIVLQFSVDKPNKFIFWNDQSPRPSMKNWDLHIVPHYHPVMNDEISIGMINGYTDAYIRGKAIRSVECPRASRVNRYEPNYQSCWNHIKHPFYAVGRAVTLHMSGTKMRSKEGVLELVNFLRATLGLDGSKYVSVNGGFRPPFTNPLNRLLQTESNSPYPRATDRMPARGSEDHCVWAYRTLEQEGVLDKAYIPPWFLTEKWLDIYEGAEERHGIY